MKHYFAALILLGGSAHVGVTLALPGSSSPKAGAAQAELTQPLFPWTQKQQNMIREGISQDRERESSR